MERRREAERAKEVYMKELCDDIMDLRGKEDLISCIRRHNN